MRKHVILIFGIKGINVVRDAGTCSYNTVEPWQSYFPGTRAHSAVEFGDRDQMPRISRFLFRSWLKTSNFSSIKKWTVSPPGMRI